MPGATPDGRSFPVHRGRCTVDSVGGVIRFEQSPRRHLHVVHVLFTAVLLALAADSPATGWRYAMQTPGRSLGWPTFLLLAAIGPVSRAAQLVLARARGFTGAGIIPLDSVESVRLTTRSVRWYLKTRRSLPAFEVRFNVDGDVRKRSITLSPHCEVAEVERGYDAFRAAGIRVQETPSATDLHDRAALEEYPTDRPASPDSDDPPA